jgi:hypothetical protein
MFHTHSLSQQFKSNTAELKFLLAHLATLYCSIAEYVRLRYGSKLQLQSSGCVVASRVVEEKTANERTGKIPNP